MNMTILCLASGPRGLSRGNPPLDREACIVVTHVRAEQTTGALDGDSLALPLTSFKLLIYWQLF